MNTRFVLTASFFLFPLLLSCSDPLPSESVEEIFGVYLLKDTSLTAASVLSRSIDNLRLADTAFILVTELQSYTWGTHHFTVTDPMEAKLAIFRTKTGKSNGVPFVVTVGLDRIYVGTFWWSTSSASPPSCPMISILSSAPYQISRSEEVPEYRNDPRIYNSLKRYGVLKE